MNFISWINNCSTYYLISILVCELFLVLPLKTTATMSSSLLDMFSLKGQTAIVTGCTRGIGEQMAVALAEAGARLIFVQVSTLPV